MNPTFLSPASASLPLLLPVATALACKPEWRNWPHWLQTRP